MNKLPSLTQDADNCISTDEDNTAREKLCVGAIRALMGQAEGVRTATKLLEAVNISSKASEEEPFNRYRNVLWKTLREAYSSECNIDLIDAITMKEDKNMHEYLKR